MVATKPVPPLEQSTATMATLPDIQGDFDDFLGAIATFAHSTRMSLLLLTGNHNATLTNSQARRLLSWFDMLARIDLEASHMRDDYLDKVASDTEERESVK